MFKVFLLLTLTYSIEIVLVFLMVSFSSVFVVGFNKFMLDGNAFF